MAAVKIAVDDVTIEYYNEQRDERHVAIAGLTGVASLAAAAGMLFGFYPRMAAALEALMLWSFTLLVWIPRVVSNPRFQENWTEWFLSAAIAASAWIVAETYRNEPWKARRTF